MDPRDLLLGKMQSRLAVDEEPELKRDGQPKAVKSRIIRFSAYQDQMIRRAAAQRGLETSNSKNRNYVELATIAFAAYDLDMNVFELITAKQFPVDPASAEIVEKVARNERGQWGIVGLSDHQRGLA